MQSVEQLWEEKRKEKAERLSVYARLDYSRGLTSQNLCQQHLVVYNGGGTNISAAHLDRNLFPLPIIVEHKLYWAACHDVEEADYLVGLLNSSRVNELIKPFQSVGLMGERDIEKKVLDIPFPSYVERNSKHRDISRLSVKARKDAEAFVRNGVLPNSLARRRAAVREHVKGTLEEIDAIVRTLI